jgi:hypothetical protein
LSRPLPRAFGSRAFPLCVVCTSRHVMSPFGSERNEHEKRAGPNSRIVRRACGGSGGAVLVLLSPRSISYRRSTQRPAVFRHSLDSDIRRKSPTKTRLEHARTSDSTWRRAWIRIGLQGSTVLLIPPVARFISNTGRRSSASQVVASWRTRRCRCVSRQKSLKSCFAQVQLPRTTMSRQQHHRMCRKVPWK